ncbi:MAG: hypothetical protein NTX65_17605 [Ignavibacteriales bacterium]|nr:hypothetical protein [Ignavibacteriales bacterium]
MNDILPLGIIVILGIIFIISYFIFIELKINWKLLRTAKKEKEFIDVEKEFDRNEAIIRGLNFFHNQTAMNSRGKN